MARVYPGTIQSWKTKNNDEERKYRNGPDITVDEVLKAMIQRTTKQQTPKVVPLEIIKLTEEEQIGIFVDLYNSI